MKSKYIFLLSVVMLLSSCKPIVVLSVKDIIGLSVLGLILLIVLVLVSAYYISKWVEAIKKWLKP